MTFYIKSPCEYASNKFIEVKVGAKTCDKIIDAHSWYKMHVEALCVEAKVASSDLIEKEGKIYFSKEAIIESSDIVHVTVKELRRLNTAKSAEMYLLARSKELETIEFPGDHLFSCLYQNEANEVYCYYGWKKNLDQFQISDLSAAKSAQEAFFKIEFPSEQCRKVTSEVARHIRSTIKLRWANQFHLANFGAKLDKLKELQLEKGRFDTETRHLLYQIVQDLKALTKIEYDCHHEALQKQLIEAIVYTFKSMKDETAPVLFQGMVDHHFKLSSLPKEMAIMLLETLLALQEKEAQQMLHDSIP